MPLYKRTITIYEKTLGPGNSRVGAALNNLAALYDDQGRYAEAEPLYERSLVKPRRLPTQYCTQALFN